MTRKLRLLLSALSLVSLVPSAEAQLGSPLFSLPYDTVCKESEFTPNLLAPEAKTYLWSFCNPQLDQMPAATSMGTGSFQLVTNNNLYTVKASEFYYSFSVADNGHLYRYQYIDGLEADPVTTDLGTFSAAIPSSSTGLFVIQDGGVWRVFVTGTKTGGASLVRLDFADGLNYPATNVHNYVVTGQLTSPRELYMVSVNDSLRAFTIDNNRLLRIDFSAAIDDIAHVENFGLMGGVFNNASGIAAIK